MGNFFNSEIIQEELMEINELQTHVYQNALSFERMEREDQLEHIDELVELLGEGVMTVKEANDVIMDARAHWFADEDAAANDADNAESADADNVQPKQEAAS